MNVIFVNTDGVLRTKDSKIDRRMVRRLAVIVRKTGAKVVLTGADRFDLMQIFEIDPLSQLFHKYGIMIHGVTPKSYDDRRDKEIITWLARNECEKFVILDSEDLCCFRGSGLIQTGKLTTDLFNQERWYKPTGLRWKHVWKAIRLLNK